MATGGLCAACRRARRRCPPDCILAPYFPANEPERFDCVRTVFGESNVRRWLEETEAGRRHELAAALHFVAHVRRIEDLLDLVRGCDGRIANLNQEVRDLQTQLAQLQTLLAQLQTHLP